VIKEEYFIVQEKKQPTFWAKVKQFFRKKEKTPEKSVQPKPKS
jgi:hypothetical protein